jgi:hypothetical protein
MNVMQFDVVDSFAGQQYGVIQRHQQLQAFSPDQIHRLRSKGVFVRMHRWVDRIVGAPEGWEQFVMAAVLSRKGAVASHLSAGRIWGIVDNSEGFVHVTLPSHCQRKMRGVITHRTYLTESALAVHKGIPVTSVERTLLDLAGCLSFAQLARALDEALRQRLTNIRRIRALLTEIGTRGRKHVGWLRTLLDERDDGRAPTESQLEKRVLPMLRRSELPMPQHQVKLTHTRVGSIRFDFAYPDLKIAIEADSWAWHRTKSAFVRDRDRDSACVELGWQVVRYAHGSDPAVFVAGLRSLYLARGGTLC